jgi:hypothetical protein
MAISSALGSSALLPAGLGFRNAIINGDFRIWQRGTSLTLSSGDRTFLADRWSTEYDGSGATRVLSQQSFTLGSPPVSGYETAYFHRFNQSVAGSSGTYNLLQQRIEDVRTFAGQTVTVTFWAKAASAFTMPSLTWQQNFGTGGSPSAGPSTNLATNIAITTSWTKYTYTVVVPSISGYTIGTTTPGFLGLRFFLPLNSTFTFDLWGVQLEQNLQPTPFEQRPIGVELALCQRYYQTFDFTVSAPYASAGTQEMSYRTHYPVQMRVAPTMSTPSGMTELNISAKGTFRITKTSTETYAQANAAGQFYSVGGTYTGSSEL